MKQNAILRTMVILVTILCSLFSVSAQTLTVTTSNGSTPVEASEAGIMTYDNSAGTITIGGTAYDVSDISKIDITESSSGETSRTVSVAYNGSSATVTISSDIANDVTVTQNGAHVNIVQSGTALIRH